MNTSVKHQCTNSQSIEPFIKTKLHKNNDLKIIKSEVERRDSDNNKKCLYDKLNLIQKVAVSELGRIGYQLHFIRGQYFRTTAILICENNIATIDRDGKVIMNPNIKIRK